jgi:hypothetical protein
MPIDSQVEVKQVRIVKGTGAQIAAARQAGEILETDLVVQTDAPEFALQSTVQAIQVLIPNDASAENQLADKGYVDSSTSGYQTTANLVTSVSSSSTDTQYPSAKLFYDTCGDIEATINAIRGV